jgi:16S rRNA (adenine1518-N6/adenine1519-N6)-dimethyltransferase
VRVSSKKLLYFFQYNYQKEFMKAKSFHTFPEGALHRPRRRFGQHFLQDGDVIDRLIGAIDPKTSEHFAEIGPGLGALTTAMFAHISHLDAIEIDRDIIPLLIKRCASLGQLTIHEADALTFDFTKLCKTRSELQDKHNDKLRVIGNLPYNISTPLIFHLLSQADCIQDMFFMLQKEVVDRITASPGSADYGRLSIMVQYRCDARFVFEVGPEAFDPPPKVDSAIVHLVPYAKLPLTAINEVTFERIVKQAFSQRRKMLRNCLKPFISEEKLSSIGIDPLNRPEQLSIADFIKISDALA